MIEAPVWNVGDQWKFKRADGGTFSQEVVEVKEDLFIVKMSGVKDLCAYDKNAMNIKYIIEEGGRQLKATSVLRRLLDFPMFVGKKWTDTTSLMSPSRRVEETYTNDFKVEGVEEVTTQAGKFNTLKIHYKQRNMYGQDGWIKFWYSPEVKMWVKREGEKSMYWGTIGWAKDAELISYKVK